MLKLGKKLCEGKTKVIWSVYENGHERPDVVFQEFTDRISAFNKKKIGIVHGKGRVNRDVSARLFNVLNSFGINTHDIESTNLLLDISDGQLKFGLLVKKLEMFPVELIIRNMAAGTFCKRYGVELGQKFSNWHTTEFCLKNDALGDPLMDESHIIALNLVAHSHIKEMVRLSTSINTALSSFMLKKNIELVDFKLEFGVDPENNLCVGDEISPDSCRFWIDGKSHDKDVYRHGGSEEDVAKIYHKIAGIICK